MRQHDEEWLQFDLIYAAFSGDETAWAHTPSSLTRPFQQPPGVSWRTHLPAALDWLQSTADAAKQVSNAGRRRSDAASRARRHRWRGLVTRTSPFTHRVYGHVLPVREREAAEVAADVLEWARSGPPLVTKWLAHPYVVVHSEAVDSREREIEKFHFSPAFDVIVDPEFPGNGDWGCPTYGFDRDGRQQDAFTSPWGAPTVIEVLPVSGERWIGQFEAGGLGGITGVFATPNVRQICVVVDGLAYLLHVDGAHSGAQVIHDQVGQVEAMHSPELLLLVRFIDIVALGPDGVEWRSQRLAVDDLRVENTSDGVITCSLDNLGGTPTIAVAASTGEQIGGTRLDSFWPPDAVAWAE